MNGLGIGFPFGRWIVAVGFCLVIAGPIDLVPMAEAANCQPIRREIRGTKKKIKEAKRIDNRARKQRTLRRLRKKQRKLRAQLAACLAIFPIKMVTVGNPGNAADPSTGYGGVDYFYRIGKYEVTVEQYTAFLNAVAKTDTYGLYHPNMATVFGGLITRNGTDGEYTYTVAGSGKRPVVYVSWFDAARFCNWLHNGRPAGSQDLNTTENGAYPLFGKTSGIDISRNSWAKYWIPSEDEWYKAAYHDPRGHIAGGPPGSDFYWLYPTRSDLEPVAEVPPGSANSANFDHAVDILIDVGAYRDSPSFYGTFDQGGNVWEWNNAVGFGSFRGLRGGSWGGSENVMRSSSPGDFRNPGQPGGDSGFRVASP